MTDATVTKKSKNPEAPRLFPDELIDQLLAPVRGKDAESILGESGPAGQLKKQLAERMLAAEPPPSGRRGRARQGWQPPQRHQPQDGLDAQRRTGAGYSARSAGDVRAAAYQQPAARLRRPRHQHVCARHERARDSRPSAATVRAVGVTRADFHGHR